MFRIKTLIIKVADGSIRLCFMIYIRIFLSRRLFGTTFNIIVYNSIQYCDSRIIINFMIKKKYIYTQSFDAIKYIKCVK